MWGRKAKRIDELEREVVVEQRRVEQRDKDIEAIQDGLRRAFDVGKSSALEFVPLRDALERASWVPMVRGEAVRGTVREGYAEGVDEREEKQCRYEDWLFTRDQVRESL